VNTIDDDRHVGSVFGCDGAVAQGNAFRVEEDWTYLGHEVNSPGPGMIRAHPMRALITIAMML